MGIAARLPQVVLGAGLVALLAGGAWPAPAMAADRVMQGVQITGSPEQTEVRLPFADGGAPVYSIFSTKNPDRLIIDLADAKVPADAPTPSGGLVQRVAYETVNDGGDTYLRVTLFLSRPVSHEARVDGGTLVLQVSPGAAPDPLAASSDASRLSGVNARVGGPELTTLDLQVKERSSKLILGLSNVEPEISQPSPTLILIDLPNTSVHPSLKRQIDARYFSSAVDTVQTTATGRGVRISVRLRAASEYTVVKEGALTVLNIPTPADVMTRTAATLQQSAGAAPSTAATNGSAGRGEEVLITGKGKRVDPQASFGSGMGTESPGGLGFAEDKKSATGSYYTGRRLSLDLQEADIHTVFRFISDFADVNIVASDDVKGTVTVRMKDVPWDEALAAVLNAKGLGAQRYGNILRVAPLETIKAEQQAALEAKKATEQLEELQLYVAPLNYAQADELTEQVAAVLSERGSVQVDARGNQLIIKDSEDRVAQIRELLRVLDRPNRQVQIEARFVEANSSFTHAVGIQWGGDFDASAATGYPTGLFFPNSVGVGGGISRGQAGTAAFYTPNTDSLLVDLGPGTAPTTSITFGLGSISGLVDINARLSAAESEGYGKILSSPRITVLDNEEARISQGARIPYQSTGQQGTNVQFVEAELQLEVTPHVTAEGTIFLDLAITNNRPDFANQVNGNPSISTKEIETRVLLPDGDTAVLGGVYSTSEAHSENRIPGLGKIPLIGALFRNRLEQTTQNEMLVFITPKIVPVETRTRTTASE